MNMQSAVNLGSDEWFAYWRPYIEDMRMRKVTWGSIASALGCDVRDLRAWAEANLNNDQRFGVKPDERAADKAEFEAMKVASRNERRAAREARRAEKERIEREQARAAIAAREAKRRQEQERERLSREKRVIRVELNRARREAHQAAQRLTPDQKFARAMEAAGGRFADAKVPQETRLRGRADLSVFVPRESNC